MGDPAQWPLLTALPASVRDEVLRTMRRRTYARGEVLFHAGDPGDTLHLVAEGRVAIRISTELGDTATLSVLGPGESFGELALLNPGSVRTATAVALDDTATWTLHRNQFEMLRASAPTVDRFLSELLATRVQRLTSLLIEALYVPAEQRVARRVRDLAEAYGGVHTGTVVRCTQDDIASLAGVSRPTANLVLGELAQAGALILGRGRIEVRDPAALARRAR